MKLVTQKIVLFIFCLLSLQLFAQEKQPDPEAARQAEQAEKQDEDPFGSFDDTNHSRPGDWRKKAKVISTQIRVEWYEVDTKPAIQALDQWQPTADAAALRKSLLTHEKTNIMDAVLTQLDVGEKSTLETIHEMIYPTEYIGPELPPLKKNKLTPVEQGDIFKDYIALLNKTGLIPVAFETRNTGLTIQMALEPVTTQDNSYDLSLVPEKVQYQRMISYGKEGLEAKMPLFSTVRANCTLRLKPGQWRLAKMQASVDKETGKPSSTRSLILFARLDQLDQK